MEWMLLFRFIGNAPSTLSPTVMECIPPGSALFCNLSFSISFPIVMYSCGSTPDGWCWKNDIRTSSARRASSWEGGEVGEETLLEGLTLKLGVGGGAMETGLLLRVGVLALVPWCECCCIAESMLRAGSSNSSSGDSSAGVAMDCWEYFGVDGSEEPGGVI